MDAPKDDTDDVAEFAGYRCRTPELEDLLRRAGAIGRARDAWDAATQRFWDGARSSSNSSVVFVMPGAGVDDEGFAVALEQELCRVLGIIR
jgi:hypothetical protein